MNTMKSKHAKFASSATITASSVLLIMGGFFVIFGTKQGPRDLQHMQQELHLQKGTVELHALPEKQRRAYVSSIEFLEEYSDLLEESLQLMRSIGIVLLPLAAVSLLGGIFSLLAVMRASRQNHKGVSSELDQTSATVAQP